MDKWALVPVIEGGINDFEPLCACLPVGTEPCLSLF